MLGKKRKPSSHLEEIEEKKDKIDIKINININNNQNNVLNNNNKNNICKLKLIPENEDFFSQVIQNEQNLFIDCEELLKMLCHCEECSKKYNEIGMNFLNEKNVFKEWTERKTFDDIINDEKFIEEAQKENQISIGNLQKSVDEFFGSKEYKQLTVEQQVLIRGSITELWNKLGEFVETLDHKVITVEDIYNFINKYKDYFENLKYK
jgi:hypothetical protein